LPVVIVCYFARGYLARLIYANGSTEIALLFGYLTLAIFFRTLYSIISRWFYAQKDTKTPLIVSVFTISLNIFLVYMWARSSSYGVAGLAMAQSIVALIEVLVLGVIMLIRDRGLFNLQFWSGVWRIISVSGFSLLAGFIAITVLPLGNFDRGPFALGGKLLLIAGTVLGTHIAISGLFGLEEARPIFAWLKRIVLRPIKSPY
jgi:putative peptidoglycan lipid II flippase